MKTTIIIPARFESSRFPGKPLAPLKLKNGLSKPLIQLSWEAANKTKGINNIFIATDNSKIKEVAESFGANVIMTSSDCENGTARCAEAVRLHRIEDEIIVNFQGDAPLTPNKFVENLIERMQVDRSIYVSTPVLRCDQKHYQQFLNDRKNDRVGATTAVFDNNNDALYFSKEVIPFLSKTDAKSYSLIPVYHHVGVYAYRNEVLSKYANWEETPLEKLEGLEQLRFLENAMKVKCVLMEGTGSLFWELNNPSDIIIIEKILGELDVR